MKVLIHACCGPCLTYTAKVLQKEEGHDVTVFWYNPNIHPYQEYQRRSDAVEEYMEKTDLDLDIIHDDSYDLEDFLDGALHTDPRCDYCYRDRLEKTAEVAAKHDLDAFSTTLVLSPYQDHGLIRKIGNEVGEKHDVEFLYRDLTDGFYESHEMANDLDLYKQGYCGCIFSERDRYKKED